MSKNVAVFVDVANIFYAAKAAGVDIDYVTLLKSAIAGRDFVRAYAYTGLDPDNENQRNFHDFLRRHGYKVVSKDIRKYGDGKVKANLDIELVVDMLKTARNLDVAIVVSGDGDFAPAIRAVQEMGVRVEVVSFRGNTSSDLMEVADQFTDIVQMARVEKGTSRSGRRVAGDEEDLSMTEVPDKQTEGAGGRRGTSRRGTRSRAGEGEPAVVAAGTGRRSTRTASAAARASATSTAAAEGAVVGLVALPGERLSRLSQAGEVEVAISDEMPLEGEAEPPLEEPGGPDFAGSGGEGEGEGEGEERRRRRRRRGGRGRGRGRGRAEGGIGGEAVTGGEGGEERAPAAFELDEEEEEAPPAPRVPKSASFGSVWDSQTGQAREPSVESTPFDLEDEEEPAIPEYLIAEQRRGSAGGRSQGGRGGRSRAGYAAAIDRERYGRGAGSGINRYPDVSGRTGGGRGGQPSRRDDRVREPARHPDRAGGGWSDEPWSEVPPEVEAMLRAQLASRPASRPDDVRSSERTGASGVEPGPEAEARPADATTRRRTSTRTTPAARATPARASAAKRPSGRSRAAVTELEAADGVMPGTPSAEAGSGDSQAIAPKRRSSPRAKGGTAASSAAATSSESAAAEDAAAQAAVEPAAKPAPKRRAPRKRTETAES